MKRSFAFLGLVVLSLLVILSCASSVALNRPVRIAVRASEEAAKALSTLSYKGGFEPKTLLYENLVVRDSEGRIAPALAENWRFENEGKECVLTIRDGARFHDGSFVTAEAVRQHFLRWVGLPEHDWIPASRRIREIRVESPENLRVVMDRPHALLPDLCAINPCAVRAPSALDFEGNFVRPVGSGPFSWESLQEGGRVLRFTLRQRPGKDGLAISHVDLVRFVNEGPEVPLNELFAGRLDLVADGWRERIPRERIADLRKDPRVRLLESPGSVVVFLGFRTESGPCADEGLRFAIRDALDRQELIARAELGHADPCSSFMAPTVRAWTPSQTRTVSPGYRAPKSPLRLLVREGSDDQEALGAAIAEQLRRANIPVKLIALSGEGLSLAVESGAFEMRLEKTWGVPYDPELTIYSRFGPALPHRSASNPPRWGKDPQLEQLVEEAQRTWDEEKRAGVFSKMQDRIDRAAILVPLYAPRRFAVLRAGLPSIHLNHDLYRVDAASVAPRSLVREP